jgi:hypothetical protein
MRSPKSQWLKLQFAGDFKIRSLVLRCSLLYGGDGAILAQTLKHVSLVSELVFVTVHSNFNACAIAFGSDRTDMAHNSCHAARRWVVSRVCSRVRTSRATLWKLVGGS